MIGIPKLVSDFEKLKQEVRRLKGRLDGISVGTTITAVIPGTVSMPVAALGAIPVGNATPAWERLAPPTPAPGDEYELTFYNADTKPVWRLKAGGQYLQFVYEVSGGDFTFIIDGDGNPVMALEDLV